MQSSGPARPLAEACQDGLSDEEILARSPTVLALTAPRVAPAPELPEEAAAVWMRTPECQRCSDNGIIREALRLRVRWVQELSGRAAWELEGRLAAAGDLPEPELVRHVTLEHVEAVATIGSSSCPAWWPATTMTSVVLVDGDTGQVTIRDRADCCAAQRLRLAAKEPT